jgi:hypothetical protein
MLIYNTDFLDALTGGDVSGHHRNPTTTTTTSRTPHTQHGHPNPTHSLSRCPWIFKPIITLSACLPQSLACLGILA